VSPTRVAVLGAGFISDYHIVGLQQAGAEVVALFGRREALVRDKAARHGIPLACTDYRPILARGDVDAVVVATPDYTHEEVAVAAAQAGKAILLQKPMARTPAECRRILEAADRAGVLLAVSFLHRYFEEVEAVRELLARGALGPVGHARQRNASPGAGWAGWFYEREKVGGGVVLQLGVHGIDLLRYLFGEIQAVSASIATVRATRTLADGTAVTPDNEDLALATYRFASGAVATHEMSYTEVAGTDRFRLEIYGERGTAWLRTERGRLAVHVAGDAGEGEWITPPLPPPSFQERQHRHWLAMVRGDAPPESSARDGLAAALVAEAVYRSAAAGCWETVPRP
jgi:myo-inositol 2-dehydrogenase/D-chiro-inositol 1-dehydrogenase